jgi:hypothetical protein
MNDSHTNYIQRFSLSLNRDWHRISMCLISVRLRLPVDRVRASTVRLFGPFDCSISFPSDNQLAAVNLRPPYV